MPDAETLIKFAFVAACCLIALFRGDKPLKIALAITVTSDFLLLFTTNFTVGVAIFSTAHMVYFYRNVGKTKFFFLYALYATVTICALILTNNALYTASAFYALCLLQNALSALFRGDKRTKAGTAAFVLCDICVAIYNLTDNAAALTLIWLFYAPSQLLLSLSSSEKGE